MERILLTGGAGFIGSHVGERLLERGDHVVVLDNFNDAYDPALKRRNAEQLQAAGAELVSGDIRDQALVGELFERGQFSVLVHLAALAGVRPSLADPLGYQDVNVRGTMVLLEQLRRRPETRLVFASSSSVYGANEQVPFREADEIHHPVSPYAATKRAGELIAWTYHHLWSIPTTCLRFFTVYGPRQRPEMAIAKFVRHVLEGRPIPFFGDGSTRRDYTYIDDIVAGVLAAIDRCAGYEIYNLGESATTSLSELVALIGAACGREPVLDRQPLQPGDVLITYADVGKARERLDYRPSTSVAEGIARYLEWLRGQPDAPGGAR